MHQLLQQIEVRPTIPSQQVRLTPMHRLCIQQIITGASVANSPRSWFLDALSEKLFVERPMAQVFVGLHIEGNLSNKRCSASVIFRSCSSAVLELAQEFSN